MGMPSTAAPDVMLDSTTGSPSNVYVFNGCPRGNAASSFTNHGSKSFGACTALCDKDDLCNAIEVNGCTGDNAKPNCQSLCFTFRGSEGTEITNGVTNGECTTDGSQRAYRKQKVAAAVSKHCHDTFNRQGVMAENLANVNAGFMGSSLWAPTKGGLASQYNDCLGGCWTCMTPPPGQNNFAYYPNCMCKHFRECEKDMCKHYPN